MNIDDAIDAAEAGMSTKNIPIALSTRLKMMTKLITVKRVSGEINRLVAKAGIVKDVDGDYSADNIAALADLMLKTSHDQLKVTRERHFAWQAVSSLGWDWSEDLRIWMVNFFEPKDDDKRKLVDRLEMAQHRIFLVDNNAVSLFFDIDETKLKKWKKEQKTVTFTPSGRVFREGDANILRRMELAAEAISVTEKVLEFDAVSWKEDPYKIVELFYAIEKEIQPNYAWKLVSRLSERTVEQVKIRLEKRPLTDPKNQEMMIVALEEAEKRFTNLKGAEKNPEIAAKSTLTTAEEIYKAEEEADTDEKRNSIWQLVH